MGNCNLDLVYPFRLVVGLGTISFSSLDLGPGVSGRDNLNIYANLELRTVSTISLLVLETRMRRVPHTG
ncbi:hypothetical protein BDV32DRAFT_120033 [Aspergillus pseudonomiae]|nr:hypothetical protein BDV32DRAFT_120033 [Aspergillus pseudonomiae]